MNKLPAFKFLYYTGGHSKLNDYWGDGDVTNSFSSFYLVQDGCLEIKTEEDEFLAGPNSLVVIPAGLSHSVYCSSSDDDYQYWMHFDMYTSGVGLLDLLPSVTIVSLSNTNRIEKLFKEILNYGASNDILSHLKLQSACFLLMAFFFENTHIDYPVLEQDRTQMIKTVVNYIHENFESSPSVETLAKMCHFNVSYFIRFFKKVMKVTPHKYIQSVQIEHAKNYLTSTEFSIKQVASSVGFLDVKHFSKIFKASTQLSPEDYRKNFKKDL